MPILHRHVVPNVPAWTADNGKIVFRNGAPSHQAGMRLSITVGGSISFTGPLWEGPSSINVAQNSWTGAGVRDPSHPDTTNNWHYNDADLATVDGYTEARRIIQGGTATHDDTGGNGWRAMGRFFGGTYYDNDVSVGQFSASLRGGAFYLDHTWDARLGTATWHVYLGFDGNWRIRPSRYDQSLFPDGASGIAPVQLWQFGQQEYDPDSGSWNRPSTLAGAVLVPGDNPVLKFDCADIWPTDGFRLGTTHRFVYSGPAGRGVDISNVYIDITASYA